MQGGNPLGNPTDIILGIPFSITLMLILGCHEFGHYYYALKHNVDATLPYFLPAPPYLFIIGTFGAFIKIKSPIYKKDALLQIGAAGPIAGFIIAVPALTMSTTLIDRLGLYLMPIQLALWPRLIAVQRTNLLRSIWAVTIIFYFAVVLFVFFNYANHAHFWLPYQIYPFHGEPILPKPMGIPRQ